MNSHPATATLILDAAESMAQQVGYNGISFREVATAVGIKSASVHYHFPTKELLGAALAGRYTDRLVARLAEITGEHAAASAALAAYVDVFRTTLHRDGRMCLGGMLAAEADTVPAEVRAEVQRFVSLNVDWIARVLANSKTEPVASRAVRDHAMTVFAALEGAMLVARGTGDLAAFDTVAGQLERAGFFA